MPEIMTSDDLMKLPDLLKRLQEQYPLDETHYFTVVLPSSLDERFGVYIWPEDAGEIGQHCAEYTGPDLLVAFKRCYEGWLSHECGGDNY